MQDELVVAFRQNFLEATRPLFLPEAWDVNHAAPRAFGEHSVYAAHEAGSNESVHAGTDE